MMSAQAQFDPFLNASTSCSQPVSCFRHTGSTSASHVATDHTLLQRQAPCAHPPNTPPRLPTHSCHSHRHTTPRAILPDRSSGHVTSGNRIGRTNFPASYLPIQVAMPAYNGSDEVVPETERIMAETVEALASIVRSPTPLRSLCAFFLVDATSHFELENTNARSVQQLASPTSSQALHFPPLATTPPARFVWRAQGDHTATRMGQPHSWQRRRCSVTCKLHIPLIVRFPQPLQNRPPPHRCSRRCKWGCPSQRAPLSARVMKR